LSELFLNFKKDLYHTERNKSKFQFSIGKPKHDRYFQYHCMTRCFLQHEKIEFLQFVTTYFIL